jgi:hypothetical protein
MTRDRHINKRRGAQVKGYVARGAVGTAVALVLGLLVGLGGAAPAMALAPSWSISSVVAPRNLHQGQEGQMILSATNLGDATADGSVAPIVVEDQLPSWLNVGEVQGSLEFGSGEGGPVRCSSGAHLSCQYTGTVLPYGQVAIVIPFKVAEDAPETGAMTIRVAGGGALQAFSTKTLTVNGQAEEYGVEELQVIPENENGTPATQAGSHPYQLTTTIHVAQTFGALHFEPVPRIEPMNLTKDLSFRLPPGTIGNPSVVPQCSDQQFSTQVQSPIQSGSAVINLCPDDTVVGVASASFTSGGIEGAITVPLFNLTPAVGEPARFGFQIIGVPVVLDTAVRTGGDYGVTVNVNDISTDVPFVTSRVSFWGVPSDPVHDASRGWDCLLNGVWAVGVKTCGGSHHPIQSPLLTLPTSCGEPFTTTVLADTWAGDKGSGAYTLHDSDGQPLGMDGCNRLPFEPSIEAVPDGQAASTPTGLSVKVHVPQDSSLSPTGLAEAQVKDTTVTLPEGVALNPSAADGLESCTEAQIALSVDAMPACPEASKVGTAKIQTPLLPNPLEGAVYLAAQNANPFGSLVALYLVAQDPVSGTLVKLAGEVKPDPVTGQLVSTFRNTPQLPFEDLTLHFFGGSRAPLGTPEHCGSYTTVASIAPWSGNAPVASQSRFDITSGPSGSACANPLGFAPSLTAGATNIQAGAFTPFTMTMSREDGQQSLDAIRLHMPRGLLGTLGTVKLCDEANANAGTCGEESLIGHTIVSVGLGGNPYSVTGGRVYITGPYNGAPYGLSIVNPAKAGPFDLGQVVVRAKIEVDPQTAALTVTTDTSGPHAIPQILDGIPLQIQHVNVSIDRPGFTFNPTDCEPMKITGDLTSGQGATSALAVPFQVTNCATLGFKPKFKASTNGKTSRRSGASLTVSLSYPKAAWGSQANIRYVKVDLPKQLPSYLETLQKACPAETFQANPAACPSGSVVGRAKAITPVIPVPLTGPAYFVSHGGAKWPELVIVLSGYGVTVQLHGETFISKGVTSSTFKYVPDVPIGSFQLTLPQGKNHALAANGNLCTAHLKMPTRFIAQNGLEIRQTTRIAATGCAKGKHRHKKHKRRHRNAKGK